MTESSSERQIKNRIITDAVSQVTNYEGSPIDQGDAERVIREAVSVHVDTENEERPAEEYQLRVSVRDTVSIKPTNILLSPVSIVELLSTSALTAAGVAAQPYLVPVAFVAILTSAYRGASIRLSSTDGFVYWAITTAEDFPVREDQLPVLIDELNSSVELSVDVSDAEREQALARLVEIGSLKKVQSQSGETTYEPRERCVVRWE